MAQRENVSYLVPRDPSITCWDDRLKLSSPCPKNLAFQLGKEDVEETIGDKIKIYLRIKPSTSSESPYTVINSTTLQTEAPKESVSYKNVTNGVGKLIHKFTFTSILHQDTTQGEFFKKCAVKSLEKFLNGENYILMAYGTTSAGKTFTMQGNVEQPGIIPRALDYVFNSLKDNIIPICKYQPHQYNEFISLSEEQLRKNLSHKNFILSLDLRKCQRYPDASQISMQTTSSSGFSEMYVNVTFKEMQSNLEDLGSMEINSSSHKFAIWVSMIEIYNEQAYDLLQLLNENGARPKLSFRDDECGNTFVKNLRYVNVSSGHEAFQILQYGRKNLRFAPTALNNKSSRSHCIFTITLAKFFDYDYSSEAVLSRYSFCDLAGIERAKKTLNVKDRLVESKAINASLSILVKCLTTIKENQNSKEKKMIPYRESKLTKLFRDAVTGKEQFSLIVNVTTEPNMFDETLNVLKFSSIAQQIVPQGVFIKPIITRVVKKSRFSRLVNSSYNSGAIDWDAATEVSVNSKDEKSPEICELEEINEKLKEALEKERERCEEIEGEVRKELYFKYKEMIQNYSENHERMLEEERERLKEMYERKEKRLIKCFEILRQNEENQTSSEDIQKLKEAEILKSKNETLQKEIMALKEKHCAECSSLNYKLDEKEKEIEELKKENEKEELKRKRELEELKKEKAEVVQELEEVKTKMIGYKSLLDEASSDYVELEHSFKSLRSENEALEQILTERQDLLADKEKETSDLQQVLSQKTLRIEKLESLNESYLKQLEDSENEIKNLRDKILMLEKVTKEEEKPQINSDYERVPEPLCETNSKVLEEVSCNINMDSPKLSKQLECLSLTGIKSTRKKVDMLEESIHPSVIKSTSKKTKKKGKQKKEENEENVKEEAPVKKKGKCFKQLFTENDFDGLGDLNVSPLECPKNSPLYYEIISKYCKTMFGGILLLIVLSIIKGNPQAETSEITFANNTSKFTLPR